MGGSEGGQWRFCWDFIYTNIVGYWWCVCLYTNVSGGGMLEGQISGSKDLLCCRAG